MSTVFKKIIDGELPAKRLYESQTVLVIEDIAPVAPVHLLLIPKKEIKGLQFLQKEDYPILLEIVDVAKEMARELHIAEGYRLLTNNGTNAGQTIFHLHFHLLGGRKFLHLV